MRGLRFLFGALVPSRRYINQTKITRRSLTRRWRGGYSRFLSTTNQTSIEDLFREFVHRLRDADAARGPRHFNSLSDRLLQQDQVRDLCERYEKLPPIMSVVDCRRVAILKELLQNSRDEKRIVESIGNYQKATELENTWAPLERLGMVTRPAYEAVVRSLLESCVPQALRFLLSLRSDINTYREYNRDQPSEAWVSEMPLLDNHLRQLFATWFSPSILQIRRISYTNTSAAVIERIVRKEAVHPVQNLDDLRNRLGPQRRVFGLYHPLLPERPLVITYVSLQQNIPRDMETIQQASSEKGPTVAAFYSISNMEPGLAGCGLGEFLLKMSADMLEDEFPAIDAVCTLSPIPGFRKWLERQQTNGTSLDAAFTERLAEQLSCKPDTVLERILDECLSIESFETNAKLHHVMELLVAHYLVCEKYRGKPFDPVARFHVGNSACLYQINVGADRSRNGWQNSYGIMVNYKYTDISKGNVAIDDMVVSTKVHQLL